MEPICYKIIASDLDGTLLFGQDEVSPENEKAIKELKEKGVIFALNSGRTFSEMPAVLRDNPDIRYYICADGATVYDKLTGERNCACLSQAQVAKIFPVLKKYDASISLHHMGKSYIDKSVSNKTEWNAHRIPHLFQVFLKYYDTMIDDFEAFCLSLDEVEMLCVWFPTDEQLNACKAELECIDGVMVDSSDPLNLEIISSRAGKGSALLRMADMLGVAHEATIAVGDGPNDIHMLRAAGLGLATSNACPELKELADEVICSNKEHIVKYILDHYIH
jgi:Cof subfamily protein (haloacid dehalogenase superfamily)